MPDSKQRTVHVNYRRQVSDGNYGTEAAEVGLEWHLDDDDFDSTDDLDVAAKMLRNARTIVLGQLRASHSQYVRQAVTPRPGPAMVSAGAVAADPADDEDPL